MQKRSLLSHYGLSLAITAGVFMAVFFKSGVAAIWPVLILAIVEITFSFDNAVINSEILAKMSRIWRTIFLTVGIAIAVFGVRLVLPLILVAVTSNESIGAVLDMALNHPGEYAEHLHEGYPVIAAFGGIFLLMIGLRFLAEDRETMWLRPFEKRIAQLNRPWLIPIAGAALATALIAFVLRPGELRLVVAAGIGALVFVIIKFVSEWVEKGGQAHGNSNKSNFINFMYLELLDASFSFDGVIAAFAITKDVILIAAGLGIGALFVRTITVHLLENGTLNDYRYLVHGAHYAIAVLGMVLIYSTHSELPEWVTGLLGVGIIAGAFYSSIKHNRRDQARAA